MNMFEEAEALSGTVSLCQMTQEEFADKLGVSQSYVANKLRLLKLSDTVKEAVLEGNLTERHARAILRIPDEKTRLRAVSLAVEERLTVAETEDLVEVLALPIGDENASAYIDKIDRLFTGITRILMQRNVCVSKSVEESKTQTKISLLIEKDKSTFDR